MSKLIKDPSSLQKLRSNNSQYRIVLCHGVFDLLHYGHLKHLKSSKKYGDILVVSITSDQFVNKGPGRPYNNESKRAEMLAELSVVDYIYINNQILGTSVIQNLRPDFYVKGPDYVEKDKDVTGGIHEEEIEVSSYGGRIVFTNDPAESSTKILNSFFSSWNDRQAKVLKFLREDIGLDSVLSAVDIVSKKKVLVIGEPIIDSYVYCNPENLSSKSPSVSANYLRHENYLGGSWAVARHLSALGCDVSLIAPHGEDELTQSLINTLLDENILVHPASHPLINTPKKTRYLTEFGNQRIFELTNLDYHKFRELSLPKYIDIVNSAASSVDLVIALDFGHGLWEGSRKSILKDLTCFRALNVQTNSGNYGYNLYTKHAHYDYLVVDEREMRLANHDRYSDIGDIINLARHSVDGHYCLTMGSQGSIFVHQDGSSFSCPTYFDSPVDTVGAGDAFFAFTSLLVSAGYSDLMVPFLGNIYAGLKTQIIGNKNPICKVSLIKSLTALLSQ